MKADFVLPLSGYLLIRHQGESAATESGVVHTDNDDTFVIYGEIVKTPADIGEEFSVGEEVVFHALEATVGFWDEGNQYSFVSVPAILARYKRT